MPMGCSDMPIIGDIIKSYFSGMLWARIRLEQVKEQVREEQKEMEAVGVDYSVKLCEGEKLGKRDRKWDWERCFCFVLF